MWGRDARRQFQRCLVPSHTPLAVKMSDYDHLFKILLVGDSNVGKSAMLVRFTDGTFSSKFTTTIGVDYKIRSLTIDHEGQ